MPSSSSLHRDLPQKIYIIVWFIAPWTFRPATRHPRKSRFIRTRALDFQMRETSRGQLPSEPQLQNVNLRILFPRCFVLCDEKSSTFYAYREFQVAVYFFPCWGYVSVLFRVQCGMWKQGMFVSEITILHNSDKAKIKNFNTQILGTCRNFRLFCKLVFETFVAMR